MDVAEMDSIDGRQHNETAVDMQDWNWWPQQASSAPKPPTTVSDVREELLPPTSFAPENISSYANEFSDDWLAQQLTNIPNVGLNPGIMGHGSDANEIHVHADLSAADATGYVFVADQELAAILGGHVDRDTIYWLLANFKLERNAVMPRGFLYSKYEIFCNVQGKALMNQACMGKTVRALFRGLETRRLGRRGKSRYHYIGLAINPEGEFAGMAPLEPEEPAPEPGDGSDRKRRRTTLATKRQNDNPIGKQFEGLDPESRLDAALDQLDKMLGVRRKVVLIPGRIRQEASWSTRLPFDQQVLPDGLSKEDILTILKDFRIHLGLIGHTIVSGVLLALPSILENFWCTHTPSLQIVDTFDADKFYLALRWKPLLEFMGLSFIELYGAVIEQFMPKIDKALNMQTLEFLYELAGKYGHWLKATIGHLAIEAQIMLNASAITFCDMLKQVSVLNSALGLVDLIERDRSKSGIVAEGFKSLSERLITMPYTSATKDQLELAVQNVALMNFIAGSDCTLQRWRGWVHNILELKLDQVRQIAGPLVTATTLHAKKEQALTDLRLVWVGLLFDLQKTIERSGKDYATPITFVLSYFAHYANFAVDNFTANLHKLTLMQYGYQVAKKNLADPENDYLASPAAPVYDISFFAHRHITNLNINVFDFHYYGNFDEMRSLLHLPNFGALSKVNSAVSSFSSQWTGCDDDDDSMTNDDFSNLEGNSDILSQFLQNDMDDHEMSTVVEPLLDGIGGDKTSELVIIGPGLGMSDDISDKL